MYFVMEETVPPGHEPIRLEALEKRYTKSWMSGARFLDTEFPPNPYALRVNPELGGTVLMELYQNAGVLMSKRLIATLRSAGVDNLDTYPATILDEESGETLHSHDAVNIVGVVSAADHARTAFDPRVPDRLIAASIESLTIDEEATQGQLLFRLAESVEAILVHETVKKRVEAERIETIMFKPPQDWLSL